MQISGKDFTNFSRRVILSIFLLFAVSCSEPPPADVTSSNVENRDANSRAANSNATKDGVPELALLVNLPEMPDEAVWREEENVNPQGKKMTAVLKYSPEAAAKVVALVEGKKPAAAAEIGTEDWFPEELTAQTQLSGNESLKGIVYEAGDFYNAPYNHGRLVRIEKTDYFLLELTSF